jgi:hypothetical protein
MISDFASVLSMAWDLFGMEFTIYGFTMSFKAVLFWSLAAGLIIHFIGRLFDD